MPVAVTAALPALPGLWSLTPIGALIGLLVLIGILLTTGKLYTKGSHQEIVQLHEKRHEAQEAILTTKDETIASLTEQNGDLIKGGEIADDFFKKVDAVLQREREDNGSAGKG